LPNLTLENRLLKKSVTADGHAARFREASNASISSTTFVHFPETIRHASGHRVADLERLIEHGVKRDGASVALDLREGFCQAA
jgi:hypothetical protein